MKHPVLVAAALCALAAPAQAQLARDFSVTVAPNYRSFSLDDELAASSASLMLLPVAVALPLGDRFSFDAYAAYARGRVETTSGTLELSGPVDTQLRGVWAATPNARVTAGVNLPTGNATHSAEEAQVAALLATDLLGFREASFGVGLGVTTGVALAHQLGAWGVGYGASYRFAGEFEPSEDADVVYSPGDEVVARLALDRNVGTGGKVTLGGTFQHFSEDEIGEDNLFQPGARIRGDASYAFRMGASSTMTFFLSDMWRQEGEVSLLSESSTIGSQNVLIIGALADLGGRLGLTPRADVRLLSHEEGTGSGWMAGIGTGVESDIAGVDVAPRVRLMLGSIEAETGESHGLTGFEVELGVRF